MQPVDQPARFRRRASSFAAICIACFSSTSFAQFEATAGIAGHPVVVSRTPGDFSYTFDDGQFGSTVVRYTSNPIASVSYAATVMNPSGGAQQSSFGALSYRFEVAAQPFSSVPIDFSGFYSSSLYGLGSSVGTAIRLFDAHSPFFLDEYAHFTSSFQGACNAPVCLQYSTAGDVSHVSTQPNNDQVSGFFAGTFDMLTDASGKAFGLVSLSAGSTIVQSFVSASATSFIDPHLEIDAAFLAANPFARLTITQGVGNEITSVSAIPEPGTYALLLAGFAALAYRGRLSRPRT